MRMEAHEGGRSVASVPLSAGPRESILAPSAARGRPSPDTVSAGAVNLDSQSPELRKDVYKAPGVWDFATAAECASMAIRHTLSLFLPEPQGSRPDFGTCW